MTTEATLIRLFQSPPSFCTNRFRFADHHSGDLDAGGLSRRAKAFQHGATSLLSELLGNTRVAKFLASRHEQYFSEFRRTAQSECQPHRHDGTGYPASSLRERIYAAPGRYGKAIDHALRQWPALLVFLEDGRLEIDNNLIENAIRPTAIGRKNWLFIGEARAGERSAILYTIIECCRRRGLDPLTYLRDVFTKLPSATNLAGQRPHARSLRKGATADRSTRHGIDVIAHPALTSTLPDQNLRTKCQWGLARTDTIVSRVCWRCSLQLGT